MSGLQKWLEKWLMPIARVLEKQKHLQAVKDGIVGIVPIIIIGSFCLVPTGIGNLVGGRTDGMGKCPQQHSYISHIFYNEHNVFVCGALHCQFSCKAL